MECEIFKPYLDHLDELVALMRGDPKLIKDSEKLKKKKEKAFQRPPADRMVKDAETKEKDPEI